MGGWKSVGLLGCLILAFVGACGRGGTSEARLSVRNMIKATARVAHHTQRCGLSAAIDGGQAVSIADGAEHVFGALAPGRHRLTLRSDCELDGKGAGAAWEMEWDLEAGAGRSVNVSSADASGKLDVKAY